MRTAHIDGHLAVLLGTLAFSGLGALVGSAAAVSSLNPRPESIVPVTQVINIGPPDPRWSTITRRTLKPAEENAAMTFEVALKMRNFSELQQRLNRGEIISPQEMAAKYDPLPRDYQAASKWLSGAGFKMSRQDSNRLALFVSGTVDQIGKQLHVTFARVARDGREYTSAISAPSVPAELSTALVGVCGLQPHLHMHHWLTRILPQTARVTGQAAGKQAQATADFAPGPYTPAQFAIAYNASPGENMDGTGQTIAIVSEVAPSTSDLQDFWTQCGISQSPNNIQTFTVAAGTPEENSDIEAALDVEWSSSIAPKAQVRVYVTGDLNEPEIDAAYQQIYSDATTIPSLDLHQMSMSYGGGEGTTVSNAQFLTDTQFFANLASAGVTAFASSGDYGSNPDPDGGPGSGPNEVEYPASDPNVTGVGGTSLTMNDDDTIYSETAWSGSGGGTSLNFKRPPWQVGTGVPIGTTRCVPDVACPADTSPGVYIVLNGSLQLGWGGTSWASPTWAGFCAMINQSRAKAGLLPVGLLGPKIYPLLGTTNFHDVTSGGNGGYLAGRGYDPVTGLGTPNVQSLIQSLCVEISPPVATIAPRGTTTFAVVPADSLASYQWQWQAIGTGTWTNLSDGGAFLGSSTSTLTITGATSAMSGDQFQCQVTSGVGTVTTATSSVLVVDQPLIITTLAGQVAPAKSGGHADGTGAAATFNIPSGIVADSWGNLYVADYSNDTIREITPDGVVTTPYGKPLAAALADGLGNPAPVNGTIQYGPARFNGPNAVAIDSANNLYVADSGNNAIRIIPLPPPGGQPGTVSTLAGTGIAGSSDGTGAPGFSDGSGLPAQLNSPEGITVDRSGNIYVADTINATIRMITMVNGAAAVTTLAGTPNPPKTADDLGFSDGTGPDAVFYEPVSVAVNSQGHIFVGDALDDVIREIVPQATPNGVVGVVTTPYGRLETTGISDGIGNNALFNAPLGVFCDSSDNLYVTDSQLPPKVGETVVSNNLIRRITPDGVVSTLAGQAGTAGSSDGTGSAAQFNTPQAIVLDSQGTIYIADSFNQTIRKGLTVLPGVSIAATQPTTPLSMPLSGLFTVTRTGSTFPSLTVNVLAAGTAVSGEDYVALPSTITVSPGASSASVLVEPLLHGIQAPNPTVQLSLDTGATYTVSDPNSATVTIAESNPYQAWKLTEFGSDAYVPSISGDEADPNHNGVPNILEYALGADPLQVGTNPSPQLSTVPDSNGDEYLAITYTQGTNPNFTYTVQVTGDLTQQTDQWHSGPSYTTVVVPPSGNGSNQVTVRDNVPLSQGAKRFIRLQVSGQ